MLSFSTSSYCIRLQFDENVFKTDQNISYCSEFVSFQVSRLKETWAMLKQNHGSTSCLYRSKLCNTLKSLATATGRTQPLEAICIPPLVSVLQLFLCDNIVDSLPSDCEVHGQDQLDWGLDTIMAHLQMARSVAEHNDMFHVTSNRLLGHFRPDHFVADMLRTETHLKLLWGAKGATAEYTERHLKFQQVLTALSEKMEPACVQDHEEAAA